MKKNVKKLNKFGEKLNSMRGESESVLNGLDSLKEFWLIEMAQIKKQSNEIKEIKPELEKLARDIQARTDQLTQEKLNDFEGLSKESIQNFEKKIEDTKNSSLDKLNEINQLANQQIQRIEETIRELKDSFGKMQSNIEKSTDEIEVKYQKESEKMKVFFSNEAMKQTSPAKKLSRLSLIISLATIFSLFIFVYIGKQTFPEKWEEILSLSFYGDKMKSKSPSPSNTP